MHKNIVTSIFLFFIVSIFLINIKQVNAQTIAQPAIGSITNVNVGTDRIIEMIQSDEDEEVETSNNLQKTEAFNELEKEISDIEVFYPPSELKISKNTDTALKKEKISKLNDDTKIDNDKPNKTKVIVSISGGNLKVDTGNGDIENKITGGDVAFVRELNTSSGKLSIGGVVDYNHNSYDNESHGIKGNGNSESMMVGVIARQKMDNGIYYEGSIRLGRAKTDFDSDEIIFDNSKTQIEYEKSSPVYAGHAKLGKIVKLDDKNSINVYGTYSFSHQEHTDIELSTKENYRINSVDSNRLKAGCRMTTKVKNGKIYYGLAYQYEASAKVKTKFEDTTTKIISGKGGSGILELGYKINSSNNNTLGIDLNASFHAGQQKGFIFQAQLSKVF